MHNMQRRNWWRFVDWDTLYLRKVRISWRTFALWTDLIGWLPGFVTTGTWKDKHDEFSATRHKTSHALFTRLTFEMSVCKQLRGNKLQIITSFILVINIKTYFNDKIYFWTASEINDTRSVKRKGLVRTNILLSKTDLFVFVTSQHFTRARTDVMGSPKEWAMFWLSADEKLFTQRNLCAPGHLFLYAHCL